MLPDLHFIKVSVWLGRAPIRPSPGHPHPRPPIPFPAAVPRASQSQGYHSSILRNALDHPSCTDGQFASGQLGQGAGRRIWAQEQAERSREGTERGRGVNEAWPFLCLGCHKSSLRDHGQPRISPVQLLILMHGVICCVGMV